MLYIKLFHGRKGIDEQPPDWGTDGPVFGPLSFVHTTYAQRIHLGEAGKPHDTIGDLFITNDLVYYDGVYYGDWSVFDTSWQVLEEYDMNLAVLRQQFYADKAELPLDAYHTPHGYDRAWVGCVNEVLSGRKSTVRVSDITPELFDHFLSPMVDAVEEGEYNMDTVSESGEEE